MRVPKLSFFVVATELSLGGCSTASLATPEDVCRQAVDSLRLSDLPKFLRICATESDVRSLLEQHPELTKQDQTRAIGFWSEYGGAKLQDARIANFQRVLEAADWDNAVIASYEYQVDRSKLVPQSDGFFVVVMINDRRVTLKVVDMILAPRGWCTVESTPLQLIPVAADSK